MKLVFSKNWILKLKCLPEIKFMPEETIFEGVEIDSWSRPDMCEIKIIIKAPSGSAINSTIPYNQVKK